VTYPGGEDLDAGVLDVPAELGDGPAGAPEVVGVVDDVVEVLGAACGAVEPERRPEELVVVAADGGVVALHLRDAAVVLAPVLVGELEQLQEHIAGQHARMMGAAEQGGDRSVH
jgi:hypothetical protein